MASSDSHGSVAGSRNHIELIESYLGLLYAIEGDRHPTSREAL